MPNSRTLLTTALVSLAVVAAYEKYGHGHGGKPKLKLGA